MVKPLSDPYGGTDANRGRHPVKMTEIAAPTGAPEYVMQLILGTLQFSPAHLRLYGHPKLLAAAAPCWWSCATTATRRQSLDTAE